jgi:hypothetical protein
MPPLTLQVRATQRGTFSDIITSKSEEEGALRAWQTLADEKRTTPIAATMPSDVGTFDQVLYWIFASTDDFDLPTFRAALPENVRSSDDDEVLCAPRDGVRGPYHAFLGWQISKDDLTLTVDYREGGMEVAPDETGPYAEDLFRWIARFFREPTVTAHVHVRLRYPAARTSSRIPLELTIAPAYDAEVYGVALALKEKPSGAVSVRLTHGQSYWYAEVVGERAIPLNRATPLDDVRAYRDVLSAFVEEKPA